MMEPDLEEFLRLVRNKAYEYVKREERDRGGAAEFRDGFEDLEDAYDEFISEQDMERRGKGLDEQDRLRVDLTEDLVDESLSGQEVGDPEEEPPGPSPDELFQMVRNGAISKERVRLFVDTL